ncbi:MAG: hypothetical protein HC862_14945 [Scytonema sp. RU_4_4]|nr:hypothetical protein [Scytonema sp. RU_4_4]NJR76819.1 hypothetical protein [Scytonema sp. CRU_2_7]
MTADLTSQVSPDFVTVLLLAATAYQGQTNNRPCAEVVVNALLQAEKAAKQQRLTYPFESLIGQWRLCFATGTKKVRNKAGIVLGKGFYVPKLAPTHISFNTTQAVDEIPSREEIGNSVQLGPVLLKLEGPAQYLGKKKLLAFDFLQMQVSLFSRVIYSGSIRGGKAQAENFYSQPVSKLPFFAFFLVTEDLIAARGRGGGLALWIREN